MNKLSYRIDDLIETFQNHSMSAENFRMKDIEKFKINYPNDELPEHLTNEFNIAYAFMMMCREIQSLRLEVNDLKVRFHNE